MLPCAAMRLTDEELLEKLRQEQRELLIQLGKKKAILNARALRVRSRLAGRERKIDTRRKILAGAMTLSRADRSPEDKAAMLKELDGFLDHPRDRELFDLPPKEISE